MYTGKTKCLYCEEEYESEYMFEGCPHCHTDQFASNVTPIYQLPKTKGTREEFNRLFPGRCLEDYREVLPFKEEHHFVDLGVGNTALTRLDHLGKELGVELYIKDETRNPTWGHKDRLNAILINKALELKAPGIVYASTGNNGASGAAFAAKAGLPCMIVTVKGVNKTMETFMQVYGSKVIGVPTYTDRWKVLKVLVDEYGWYPATNYVIPAIGSNPWGIEGYKVIAYELFRQMPELPDKIIVPICYGDALFGIMKGFEELKTMGFIEKIPQMVSIEDYGPVAHAFETHSDIITDVASWGSVAASMSTGRGTYQSLYAVRHSNGLAVALSNNQEICQAQSDLAQKEGVYCESSSATTLAGLRRLLAKGLIKEGERIVMLITASGVKDTEVTETYTGEIPEATADIQDVKRVLKETYGLNIE